MKRRALLRRYRQRASERGATLFVVVLAITLLTGIGLFTVHSSSLLARAAGNQREAAQVSYLSELGTLTALSVVGAVPQTYANMVDNPRPGDPVEDCRATQGVSAAAMAKCIELASNTITPPTGATIWANDSFGPVKDPTTGAYALGGRFDSEISDIYDTGERVPGMAATNTGGSAPFGFKIAKITTTATLQPAVAAAACVENVMQMAGQHMTRADVRLGPVQILK